MTPIDPKSWLKVCDQIREAIESGRLFAESELKKETVTPNADNSEFDRALNFLANEGLLLRGSGNRFIVAKPRARSRRSASFQRDYSAQNRKPTRNTLELKILPLKEAPELVRAQLESSPILVRHHHVQIVDDIPHAIADSYVPYDILGERFGELKERDVFDLLGEVGHPVTHKEERLHVDTPSLPERELLGMVEMPTLPVIRLYCIVWSKETVVEVCLLCDRADLYEFQYPYKIEVDQSE